MENENPVKNESIISQNSSNDFLLLFSDIKEQPKLLRSFSTFINEYLDLINNFYNKLKEITNNYLSENIFKTSMENLPIFRLGKTLRDIVQSQLNKLENIIKNQNIFKEIDKDFADLIKIIKEYKTISGDSSKGHDSRTMIQPVVLSLIETYNDIEFKIVDDYIIKKYNKRIFGEKKEIDLDMKLLEVNYLEKTFLEFGESSKNLFFKEFQEIQKKTLNSFNIIKDHMKTLSEIILKQNCINIYENQNEIDFIGKNPQIKNEDKAKNYNLNTPKENNNMFKLRIKTLEKKYIKIIDIDKEKNKNYEEQNSEEKLILNEEDKYNIVEQLYNLNMKMLDKSGYNLAEEKKKIEVEKLAKKLLSINDNKQELEQISNSEVEHLIELLNNNEINMKGKYELNEKTFNILVQIFNMTQDFLLEKKDASLENLIIILSQTFFIKKNMNKYYIVNDIKNHQIFKSEGFWKNQLKIKIEEQLTKINNNIKRMNLNLPEKESQKQKDETIFSQFVPISTNMKEFGLNSDIILNIANQIFESYNTGDETKALILSLLKN